jgi:hypothetical protein
MNVPDGQLVRSRVVDDAGPTLRRALDARLTGYVLLTPQSALLSGTNAAGVVTFRDGVPALAYHAPTDSAGSAALTELADHGPYRSELYEVTPAALDALDHDESLSVAPTAPARPLTSDDHLVERTLDRAPAGRLPRDADPEPAQDVDALEAFLDDTERIEAIRARARDEARRRATEWGLDTVRSEPDSDADTSQ